MPCQHPDPRLLSWLFCRTCGYFVNGVREGDATNDQLRERLKEGQPVEIIESKGETRDEHSSS